MIEFIEYGGDAIEIGNNFLCCMREHEKRVGTYVRSIQRAIKKICDKREIGLNSSDR